MSAKNRQTTRMSDLVMDTDPLENIAPAVLENLAKRFADLLRALPSPVTRAVDLATQLEIERSLAWKVWRVAQSEHSIPSPRHIPGSGGVKLFLEATERKVPRKLREDAWAAFSDFENLIRTHTSSRAALNSMLSRFTTEGRERLEINIRREGFRARSHFVGVAAKAQYRAFAIFPGEPGYGTSAAALYAYSKVFRMRTDASWVLYRAKLIKDREAVNLGNYQRGPLGPPSGEESPDGLGAVIREFSSDPAPDVRWIEVKSGIIECVLESGPIGEKKALDWAYGELITNSPMDEAEEDGVIMNVITPSEHVCFDLFLHRDISPTRSPRLLASANPFGDSPLDVPHHCIPLDETVMSLGSAESCPPSTSVPDHRRMIRYIFDQIELAPADFRAFRVDLRYPPVPLSLELVYPHYSG